MTTSFDKIRPAKIMISEVENGYLINFWERCGRTTVKVSMDIKGTVDIIKNFLNEQAICGDCPSHWEI